MYQVSSQEYYITCAPDILRHQASIGHYLIQRLFLLFPRHKPRPNTWSAPARRREPMIYYILIVNGAQKAFCDGFDPYSEFEKEP